MLKVLSVDNMRRSDAHTIATKTPSKELMFLAWKSIYENVTWKPPVAIVCGSGNNAGDGYVVAQLLHDNGIDCSIFMLSSRTSQDGAGYLEGCNERGIPICNIEDCGIPPFARFNTILDCIFGTGFKGDVKGLTAQVIQAINESSAYRVSVDINSGLDGDNGLSKLCVHSDLTVSIGDYKPGHFLNMAKDVMTKRINCDIGIEPVDEPYWLLQHGDFNGLFTPRSNYSNKGSFGYIALIGGSTRYSGAIKLAAMANAAMRSGAGVVKVAAPKSLTQAIAPYILESTLFPLSDDNGEAVFCKEELDELMRGVRTIAFGMGIGVTKQTTKMLLYMMENYEGTLIIDAGGLNILSRLTKQNPAILKDANCSIVLTPHAKEFSRLLGKSIDDYMENPIEEAKLYARQNNAIVLLKGPTTIITNGKTVYLTDSGGPGMATAGSGDVLSGILAAICSWAPTLENLGNEHGKEDTLLLAVAAGSYINGRAGEIAQTKSNPISMTAGDTADSIKDAISEYFND